MSVTFAGGPGAGIDVNSYDSLTPEMKKAMGVYQLDQDKKTPINIMEQFMPAGVTRSLQQSGYTVNPIDFLGGSSLMDNPDLYNKAIGDTYSLFNKNGVSILDPMHPLGQGGDIVGGNSGGGFDINTLLKQILNPSGGGMNVGGTTPGVSGNLLDKAKSSGILFSDLYKPSAPTADKYFQDLLDSVSNPTSVDAVQKGLDTDTMNQLLSGIDKDTAAALANNRLDIEDRGFGGPGNISELETASAAGINAGAVKSKAQARTAAAQSEIDRLKAREAAKTAALGTRYTTAAASDTTDKGIAAQSALSTSNLLSGLLGTEFQGGITTSEGDKNRNVQYLNTILDAALKGQELSQQDKQFLQKLMFDEEQGSLDRSNKITTTKLSGDNASNIAQGNNDTSIITAIIGGLL